MLSLPKTDQIMRSTHTHISAVFPSISIPAHEFFTTPTFAALNTLPFNVNPLLCV
jgi:hypothetical protein